MWAFARELRRGRGGVEVIESLFLIPLALVMTLWAVLLTWMFGNALVAQHALSQTALYVASSGRYTTKMDEFCLSLMPSPGGASSGASCQAFIVPANGTPTPLPPDGIAPYNTHLRVEVSYQQPIWRLCITGGSCAGKVEFPVVRSLDFRSQTQTQELRP